MQQRSALRRRATAAALMMGLGVAGYFTVRAQPTGTPKPPRAADIPNEPILRVSAVAVSAQTVSQENALSGQVEPYTVATIAAEVGERLLLRPVEQGERIAQGGLLAQLDARIAQTALERAVAAQAQATAARRQAETDYARAVVETDAARQQARAQLAQAQAGERQATAQRTQAGAGERKARRYTRLQELRQAEAGLSQAKTDERLAKIEHDRYAWLVQEGAAPQQTLDRVKATLDAAIARRESAEQTVSLAQEGARQEDIEIANAQSQAAQAQWKNATAQIETARAAVRIADTRDTRLASIRRQIESLRAQEAQAAVAVRQAQINLHKHRIVAPFTGRILATLAQRGETLAPGTPIVRLGATDRVKVVFNVPEASRPLLRLNQNVVLTVDALPNRTFAGRIATLGFQADPRARAFPIEVVVQNQRETLLPNMVARLRLPIGNAAPRLRIPASAVATDGAATFVYLLENERAIRRDVTLGAPQGDQVEVLRGLEAGARIAAAPQRLTDGAKARIEPTEEAR